MHKLFIPLFLLLLPGSLFAQQNPGTSVNDADTVEKLIAQQLALRKTRLLNIEHLLGKQNTHYADALVDVALVHRYKKMYDEATSYLQQAVTIQKQVAGEKDSIYSGYLLLLADVYDKSLQYHKAAETHQQYLAYQEKTTGKYHKDYLRALERLIQAYINGRYFNEAEPMVMEYRQLCKKMYKENSANYGRSLFINGLLLKAEQEFVQAEPYYKKALEIYHADPTLKKEDRIFFLAESAEYYEISGQFSKAETLYTEALQLLDKTQVTEALTGISLLRKLAFLYSNKGAYNLAEPLYETISDINKKYYGETSWEYGQSVLDMGTVSEKLGQPQKAETFFLRAKNIIKIAKGDKNNDYEEVLYRLLNLYTGVLKDHKKANSLLIEVEELGKALRGENSVHYAEIMNTKGFLYGQMGNYDAAILTLQKAKQIVTGKLSTNHQSYIDIINTLAIIYEKAGKYSEAEQLYKEIITIYKQRKEFGSDTYSAYLKNFASFYMDQGEYNKAESLITEATRLQQDALNISFSTLSEKEKENYIANNFIKDNINLDLLCHNKNVSDSFLISSFNTQLQLKSFLLLNNQQLINNISNNKDTLIQSIFSKWKQGKELLAKQYSLPVDKRDSKLDTLELIINNMEKQLARVSVGFNNKEKELSVDFKKLQAALKNNEAVIQFVRFNFISGKEVGTPFYAAYIVRKNDRVPIFVPLCDENRLSPFFYKTGNNYAIQSIYRSTVIKESGKNVELGDSLYSIIWKPLMPYLANIELINYSPAGLLYKVAFNALPAGDKKLLIDYYQLNQYVNLRQLVFDNDIDNSSLKSIALFGNSDFDAVGTLNSVIRPDTTNTPFLHTRGDYNKAWSNLPGTLSEINNIQSLFTGSKVNTMVYSGRNASEENFKLLSNHAPSVIHLATHGFFLPDINSSANNGRNLTDKNAFINSVNPMMRSGIVLAGANKIWGGILPDEGKEDGVVTAYEISQLNLSKTNLVILSACETALGDIKGNEGVFGLQRAFKLAGVKNMILSLWKVPDTETAELMTIFYRNYLTGKTIKEAFTAAQKEMRLKYNPYSWAAFVLIE